MDIKFNNLYSALKFVIISDKAGGPVKLFKANTDSKLTQKADTRERGPFISAEVVGGEIMDRRLWIQLVGAVWGKQMPLAVVCGQVGWHVAIRNSQGNQCEARSLSGPWGSWAPKLGLTNNMRLRVSTIFLRIGLGKEGPRGKRRCLFRGGKTCTCSFGGKHEYYYYFDKLMIKLINTWY